MGIGAHMTGLRRIRAGIFKESKSVRREDFEKAVEEYESGKEENLRKMIIPAEIVSEVYPSAEIKKEYADKLMHGAPIDYKFLIKKDDFDKGQIVCVFTEKNFVGMFKVINEGNIFAKPEFVLQPLKG